MEYVNTTWYNEDYETQELYQSIDQVHVCLWLDVEYSKPILNSDNTVVESIRLDCVEFISDVPFTLQEIIEEYYRNLGKQQLEDYV
jgi:hypothetical protein